MLLLLLLLLLLLWLLLLIMMVVVVVVVMVVMVFVFMTDASLMISMLTSLAGLVIFRMKKARFFGLVLGMKLCGKIVQVAMDQPGILMGCLHHYFLRVVHMSMARDLRLSDQI
uniref:Uncharacterized protein n=1 Tax=Hanusia phi TaxID=3032 RepID=A0A7S0EMW9_9CRYP